MDTLRHLQIVVLNILKDIDALCDKNGITYYLSYGSALGAVRHAGIIPWDDDIDIMLDAENYKKFISACKNQLSTDKYYFEESCVDWPMPYSKLKLRNTFYPEDEVVGSNGENGIFIDIFKLDNFSSNPRISKWQYFCAKVYLAYCLSQRTYKSANFKKKVIMALSCPLQLSCIRTFVVKQIEKYNKSTPMQLACCYTRYGYHASVIPASYFGTPKRIKFEDTEMPVPCEYDKYLTQVYGDYMTPPPIEKRSCDHLNGKTIDFGAY